jgi:type I restriction enzyme S subunit
LDDKIELNRRMNETLEGMAQALFKSWFVDFDPVIDNALAAGNPIPEPLAQRAETRRQAIENGTANRNSAQAFPASFRFTEELGWIPEGWKVSTIEDCTSTIIDHRGKTPKKLGSDWSEFGHPAISAKNIKDGRIVRHDTIRYTDPDLYSKWMSEELQSGDVIMTSEAPLGEKLYLSKGKKWVLSQRLFALRANERISGIYLYRWLSSEAAKADIDGRASGTTVIGIKQSELRQVKVLEPCQNSLGAFANFSTNLEFDKENNLELSQTLAKLRDVLLPKLISGELRIPQAEKMVEKAVA